MITHSTFTRSIATRQRYRIIQCLEQRRICINRSINYHSKVTALPFVLSPAEASSRVLTNIFFQLYPKSTSLREILQRLRSGVAQPIAIQPFYFPTWYMDMEAVVTDVTELRGPLAGKKQTSTSVTLVQNIPAPGNHTLPLSIIPFYTKIAYTHGVSGVPWNPSLAKFEDGREITCLPYTLSPFSLPKMFVSLKKEHPQENFTRSWLIGEVTTMPVEMDVLPAYPVLLPLYIVQYEALPLHPGDEPPVLSAIVEAYDKNSPVFSESLGPEYREGSPFKAFFGETIPIPEPSSGDRSLSMYVGRGAFVKNFYKWAHYLSAMLGAPEDTFLERRMQMITMWNSLAPEAIPWCSSSIRPFTENEQENNTTFHIQKVLHLQKLGHTIMPPISLKKIRQSLWNTKNITDKPRWYTDWEKQGISNDEN